MFTFFNTSTCLFFQVLKKSTRNTCPAWLFFFKVCDLARASNPLFLSQFFSSLSLSFSLSISLSLFLSSQISVLRENSSDKDIVWYNSNKVLFSLHFKSYHKDSLTVCLVLFTNGISLRLILSTTLESRRLINESLKSKCRLFVITLFIFCYNNAWHCILISNVKQEFDFLKMSKEIKILNM